MKVSSPKQYIPAVENSSDVVHHFTIYDRTSQGNHERDCDHCKKVGVKILKI